MLLLELTLRDHYHTHHDVADGADPGVGFPLRGHDEIFALVIGAAKEDGVESILVVRKLLRPVHLRHVGVALLASPSVLVPNFILPLGLGC